MKATLSLLVHGDAGVGKSWLGGSAPPPVLVLDAEGRGKYLPYAKVFWDPTRDAPPVADGTWTHCIVAVTKYQVLETVYQWLESGQHPFVSVVLDSLMAVQKRLIDKLTGTAQLQQQDWGEVLRALEQKVRDLHDLTLSEHNTVNVVVLTCGTKDVEGKRVPLLQGALRDTLAYLLDAVGYLYLAPGTDGQQSRNLLVQPTATIVAKDGTNMLGGPVIGAPNLTTLYAHLQTAVEGATTS